ncbi:MAG: hypothetical protein ACOZAO_05545 [Patescibacteria group bacterium]
MRNKVYEGLKVDKSLLPFLRIQKAIPGQVVYDFYVEDAGFLSVTVVDRRPLPVLLRRLAIRVGFLSRLADLAFTRSRANLHWLSWKHTQRSSPNVDLILTLPTSMADEEKFLHTVLNPEKDSGKGRVCHDEAWWPIGEMGMLLLHVSAPL